MREPNSVACEQQSADQPAHPASLMRAFAPWKV